MTLPRFLQFHILTSYPASLLNRDDAGFAKRIPFGGASRIRISSQCLKRHWRTFDGEGGLSEITGAEFSLRSRRTFKKMIFDPLVDSGVSELIARDIVRLIKIDLLLGTTKKKKTAKDKMRQELKESSGTSTDDEDLTTSQLTVYGPAELSFLFEIAQNVAKRVGLDRETVVDVWMELFGKEQKENIVVLKAGAGLDAAMFGRMVTSDILSRVDAAVHVAHAMTVHGEQSEPDYFTAVDDLQNTAQDDSGSGSAHINTTELTSGLYYCYVSIDLPQLVSNLEGVKQEDWEAGDMSLAKEIISRLPRILATVSPGAKKGSTAPFAYAHLVLAELGSAQPRTLANAFLKPVSTSGDVVANTYSALGAHLAELDLMYGNSFQRVGAALGDKELLSSANIEWGSIDSIGKWVSAKLES